MEEYRIIVTISPKGVVTIQPMGVPGTACKDVTAAIEKALGTVVSDVATSDADRKPVENHLTMEL